MANIKYNFSSGNNGTVNYSSDIVDNIVKIAVKEVEGVYDISPVKPIRLTFDKENIAVDVAVVVEYSSSVTELAYRIQASIKQVVESMTRYKVSKVDVHVQDVIFPEEVKSIDENKNVQR